MCDKTVGYFLPTLKVVSYWFTTSKMIKTLEDAVFLMTI